MDLFCSLSLFSALIVSSDTLNIMQDVSTQQKNDIPKPEISTESDKNDKQVISESKTETIDVNSDINSEVINGGNNAAEKPNSELLQQEEQTLELQVIVETQIAAPGQQTDTKLDQSIEIENVNDDNA